MTPIQYRFAARADIDAVYAWYESKAVGLGERFLATLHKRLTRIRENPDAFAPGRRGVRSASLGRFPYVVYFVLNADGILLLAVMHGRRKPGIWRSRL